MLPGCTNTSGAKGMSLLLDSKHVSTQIFPEGYFFSAVPLLTPLSSPR